MGTHPIFESDFDCLTEKRFWESQNLVDTKQDDKFERSFKKSISITIPSTTIAPISIL